MHTVIMKREIYEKNPWIAMNLYKAFCQAKNAVMKAYSQTHVHVTPPWIHDEIERTQKILGSDWWPYGVQKNRHVLETFLRITMSRAFRAN
jgi:4,5-dihydroxyphthalate decarboxylase